MPRFASRPRRLLTLGLLPVAGVLAAACSSGNGSASTTTTTAAPSTPATTAGPQAVLKTATVSGVGSVLVNTQGQVVYSFTTASGAEAPCNSSCLAVWPAVTLPTGVTTPTGGAGVGTLGTTTSNGPTQVTADGHALYTFAGDPGPDTAKGNGLNTFGGIWKVVKAQ